MLCLLVLHKISNHKLRHFADQVTDARQHPLFPTLDYLAKNSFKQAQVLEQIKAEVHSSKEAIRDGNLQEKGDVNIDQYKVS